MTVPVIIAEDRSDLAQNALEIVRDVTSQNASVVCRILQGMMTFKFVVRTENDESFVVRFYPTERQFVINYEPDVIRRCRAHGLPVPRVLADSRTGPPAKLGYLIYEMIPGQSLSERLKSPIPFPFNKLGQQLAECFWRFQEIRFDGAGELLTSVGASHHSWREFVRAAYLDGIKAAESHGLFNQDTIDNLKVVGFLIDSIPTTHSQEFVWNDASAENILVDDHDELAGLVDFEGVLSGDGLATLGCFYAREANQECMEAMMNHWPKPLTDEERKRVLFYSILRVMRVAPFAHAALPTGLPRDPLAMIFPNFHDAINNLRSLTL